MGEATCFLRARFRTPEEAKSAMLALDDALRRLGELGARMLELRNEHDRPCGERRRELTEAFRDLEAMIPWGLLGEQCAARGNSDRHMNCAAHDIPDITAEHILWAEDRELRLEDTVIPSWEGIVHWLKVRGALAAGWIAEHEMDPWASIRLEE